MTAERVRNLVSRPGTIGWILAITLIVGGALRFVGVLWGLPLQLHADEWVIVEHAIDMARRNSFEPQFFSRPDHLEIILSYIAYVAYSHLLHGVPPEVLFDASQAPFYAISRCITAAFGTAMIAVAFLIGRLFAPAVGLLMAIAVAVFPPFVENSRVATPDVPLTFTVMIVILGTMLYLKKPTWGALILACVGVGAGITAKYPAVIGTFAIAAAIVISALKHRRPWQIAGRGFAAVGFVIATVFAISPVLFTNASEVARQLTTQNSDGHLGASGLDWRGNLSFYAGQMANSGGLLLLLFAMLGAVWCVYRRQWLAIPLALGLAYWIVLSRLSLHWDRWGLPMYLTVVLVAAIGVWAAWRAASRIPMPRLGRAAVGVLGSISLLAMLLSSLANAASALAVDTRAASARDLEAREATVENTAFDGYTAFRTDGPGTVAAEIGVDAGGEPVSLLDDGSVRFIMTSSYMSNRYLADAQRPESLVYQALAQQTPLERWDSVGSPPRNMFELALIPQAVGYIAAIVGGGHTGPTITLYLLPSS